MSEPLSTIELQRMETVIDKAEISRAASVEFLTEEMRRLVDEVKSFREVGTYEDGYEEGKGDAEAEYESEDEEEDIAPRPLALGRV